MAVPGGSILITKDTVFQIQKNGVLATSIRRLIAPVRFAKCIAVRDIIATNIVTNDVKLTVENLSLPHDSFVILQ